MFVNKAGAWTQVPQEPDRIFVNNGGVWTPAKQVWVASPVGFDSFEWKRAWRVPEPPAGVKPDLEQFDGGVPVFTGGDVRASWVNTTTDFAINVEWEINSSVFDSVTVSAGSVEAFLDRSNLSNGDEVRARMRYFEGAVAGDFSAFSDTLTYVDF